MFPIGLQIRMTHEKRLLKVLYLCRGVAATRP